MLATLIVAVLTAVGGERVRIGSAWTRLPSVTTCTVALLGWMLLRDALAGWRRWRLGLRDRYLTHGEWVLVLGTMAYAAFLLSLGPIVSIGGREAGAGLYDWLHPYALPLRAIRGTTRFGLLVLTVVALLAGLGSAWLLRRWPARRAVTAALVCALMLDYLVPRPPYQWIEIYARPVDAILRAHPEEVAVLEWPLNDPDVDVDAKLRSVGHRQRVVNGFAGFVLEYQRELSRILSTAVPPFASPAARTALAQIYPLRHLVVRDVSQHRARPAGQALADASNGFLHFRGTHGPDDLYDVVALPERGRLLSRLVPFDVIVTRPVVRAALRPVRTQTGVNQTITLTLNEAIVTRMALDATTTVSATLTGPFSRAEPNVIGLEIGYHRTAAALGPKHRLGRTGLTVPVDAVVRSAGHPYGDAASIRVGVGELAPNTRGYNLVALDPSGATRDRDVFDTFRDPAANEALRQWVDALPAGTIVLGAVKDEASGRLDAAAVRALGTLGVRGDLRGHFLESHAFIGVKGASPGSAIEALGRRPVEVQVGEPDVEFALELTEFELDPPIPGATIR
jgi:hypothetical protein